MGTEQFQEDINDTKKELNKSRSREDELNPLDAALAHVGDMGRYQKLLFLAMLPFGFFFAFVYFVQMFIAATPQRHWCRVPELQHLDMELRRNLSAPGAVRGEEWDRCATFNVNWSHVLQTLESPEPGTPLVPCQHGWEFELTDIPYETVVTEREWVCENASYAPTAQAIFFAGSFIGGIIFGWVADKYGRVPALVGSNLIGAIGGIATIYTSDFWDYTFCRFLTGMAYDNAFMMMYILVLEYVGPKHRTWVGNMSVALFFGAGAVSLPWLALWISDWRQLLWVTSSPMLMVVFAPFVLPESARWYVSRGRTNKAVEMLKKFERVNGKKIPDDVMDDFIVSSSQTKQTKESLGVLLKSATLRIPIIMMLLVYMSAAIIFDALVRLSDAFGLDFFLTFSLTSFTEIPSVTLLAFLLDRWGRRWLACGPMAIAGALILTTLFVPKGIPQASLAIMSRFFVNMAYSTAMQWCPELLPTAVRASASSAVHMMGYVATVLSPFIVYSEHIWSSLPLIILGSIALMSSGMSLMLPETMGIPMPQTIADGERIVKENSLCGKPEDIEIDEWRNEKQKALIT